MRIDFGSITPVYQQIAEIIEDDIISGRIREGEAAYSQLVLSRELNVNPATAAKGINTLVAKGILEKQRGAAMTVAYGAVDKLLAERKGSKFKELIVNVVTEATKLKLSKEDIIAEIEKHYKV